MVNNNQGKPIDPMQVAAAAHALVDEHLEAGNAPNKISWRIEGDWAVLFLNYGNDPARLRQVMGAIEALLRLERESRGCKMLYRDDRERDEIPPLPRTPSKPSEN